MRHVLRTPLSRRDIKEIGHDLARESGSRAIALRFLDLIATKCDRYAEHPELGEACPALAPLVRRFPVGSYIVYYRPISGGIELLRILHGSRDILTLGLTLGREP